MTALPNVVLVDIDHTVADAFWRDHLVPVDKTGGEEKWDPYHEAGARDLPNKNVLLLLQRLYLAGYQLVGLTARPERWRRQTMEWCARHGVPLESLLMRPEGNRDPSPKVKVLVAIGALGGDLKSKVAFVLEDRADVAKVFRDLGIVVLQVHISRRDAMSVPYSEAM